MPGKRKNGIIIGQFGEIFDLVKENPNILYLQLGLRTHLLDERFEIACPFNKGINDPPRILRIRELNKENQIFEYPLDFGSSGI